MLNKNIKAVAFFDAEFTSKSTGPDKGEQELIQYAILIYQIIKNNDKVILSDEPIFLSTSYVKPSIRPTLSKYIKKLTKITQQDVDEGKPLFVVFDEIYDIVKKYNIKDIFVWGPDRLILKTNLLMTKTDSNTSRFVCGKFNDLSRKISQKLGYDRPISQSLASEKLGLTEIGQRHNAYYDALNLSQIYKEIFI